MRIRTWARFVTVLFSVALGIGGWLPTPIKAQAAEVPQFRYDPFWPKLLPDGWVLGSVGSVCVDARDHVFAVTRGEPAPKERNLATPAPPVIEFDADGTVTGKGLNASHTSLFKPAQVAVDPSNGDVYVSDGYGNKRVVVFDRQGHYLR